MAIRVIALNRDVSSMLHCIEIISHSFSILSSVESASIPCITATSFFLPHQNLAKSHHLSSGAKDSKPLKYINTDIREQNIYNYD